MSMSAASGRLRLFCAIELPGEVRARCVEHLARLREHATQVKITWERVEKLHVTMKFFGATEAERLDELTAAVARAAAAVPAFELTLTGAGTFPAGQNPRVLWLGTKDSTGALTHLHQRLESECAAARFPREARPFHAHITLARLRAANAATRQLARFHEQLAVAPAPFKVNDLIIMRSDLNPDGSQYTTLSRHPLQSGL
jgi:2'-5' RNA ligase